MTPEKKLLRAARMVCKLTVRDVLANAIKPPRFEDEPVVVISDAIKSAMDKLCKQQKALLFYANSENYELRSNSFMISTAIVQKDCGALAREALKDD